jgi:nucleoside-diphosphate-sugar epimerase
LRQYKRSVRHFRSIYVPHFISHALCFFWEKYSRWSHGQLPPAFNRSRWYIDWRRTRYSNEKLKSKLGWAPKVPTEEAMRLFFKSCTQGKEHA